MDIVDPSGVKMGEIIFQYIQEGFRLLKNKNKKNVL